MFNLRRGFLILLGPRFGLTSVVRPQKGFDATDSLRQKSDLIFTSVCRRPGCTYVLPGDQLCWPPVECCVPSSGTALPPIPSLQDACAG